MNREDLYSNLTYSTASSTETNIWLLATLSLFPVMSLLVSQYISGKYLRKFWVALRLKVAPGTWYASSKLSVRNLLYGKKEKPSKDNHPKNRDASKERNRCDIDPSKDEAWPQSEGELWRDRHHSGAWYTFWIAVFVASLPLVFALLQLAIAILSCTPHTFNVRSQITSRYVILAFGAFHEVVRASLFSVS